jgi:HAD superfamily hydrolase (TIGR01509 family)
VIRAVIFDFFGVLVGDGFESTYRKAGGDPVEDRLFVQSLLDQANRGEITVNEFRTKICKQLGISVEEYQESAREAETVNYELLEYVNDLRQRKYKTAILSNVNKGGLERRIDKDILEKYFDAIVVSGDVGFIKPEPEIYKITADKLGVRTDECAFTDDRKGYVEAAKALGMESIFYQDFLQFKSELEKLLAADSNN